MANFRKISRAEVDADTVNGTATAVAEMESQDEEIVAEDASMQALAGQAAQAIVNYLIAVGEASRNEIRAHCADNGIPTDIYQKGFRIVSTTFAMIVEEQNDQGAKVWRLKRKMDGVPDIYAMLNALNRKRGADDREKYGNWYTVTGSIRLVVSCYSSQPGAQQGTVVFLRDGDNNILLLDNYFARMFQSAARLPLVEASAAKARFELLWDFQTLPVSLVKHIQKPVPPARPGLRGQGLTNVEALLAGTEIPFRVLVPGSHISFMEMTKIMRMAGRFIGFSPAAAKKGYGRFTVAKCEMEDQNVID